ncbi:HlyD family secretion protein [Niabella sp. W65]|nr:HlyD family secretion protein [Niabella sp. W65]MCH7366738.1 HlyD family secretion protein [Niabella sp. W65]ULT42444.1 HlyD family secretion protein [Niabella sp. I65]
METLNDKKQFGLESRTEEVQDIIDRMPTKFGYWVGLIVLFIVLLMVSFGFIIRYPDVVAGKITINTSTAPIKLVANTNGKIILEINKSLDFVKQGEVIAHIENSTDYKDLVKLKTLLLQLNPNDINVGTHSFPHRLSLGGLSAKYYIFLNALNLYNNFVSDKLYDKKIAGLRKLGFTQEQEFTNINNKAGITKEYIENSSKLFRRDSVLFHDRVLSESDLEKSKLNELSYKMNHNNITAEKLQKQKDRAQVQTQITEATIQKEEKLKELLMSLTASYNDLKENISMWEQTYLITAPFDGQVQFLKFWTTGQYVQASEPVFTILPIQQKPYGQVIVPSNGAGKVKEGQEVVIKLDNYPYNEYGAIRGEVSSISKTTNVEKTKEGDVETYLISVALKDGLVTNYGKKLEFVYEGKGSAEIITNDRKLIERFFDNLKYVANK